MVVKYLKWKNPNSIMKIEKNTIVKFDSSKRLCKTKSFSNTYAHFHRTKPHRICIKQKILGEPIMLKTGLTRNDPKRVWLNGNFALVELMCHELGHHRTKGHGKKFHEKYNDLLGQMSILFISGEFYRVFR